MQPNPAWIKGIVGQGDADRDFSSGLTVDLSELGGPA